MNILKRELRAGLKPFLFWTLGLFVLVFAGMVKYTGISAGGVSINELLAQFPRVVLAVLGIVGIDIETLGGYYAVIVYFAIICVSIYAVFLGANAVNRESIDKTYEFIFTKPRSRKYILLMKLLSGFIYLSLFCLLHYLFSISATATLKLSENINHEMLLFSLSVFFVGLLFFGISTFAATIANRPEKGMFYGNLCFLFSFVIGIIYDMLENGKILRIFTPIRYFLPSDLLSGYLDPSYIVLCLVLTFLLFLGSFHFFENLSI